jgi:dihydrofolate reductase
MGKIVAGLRVSVDGVAGEADKWSFDYLNPEVQQAIGANMAQMGTMMLGRVTYDIFAASWPGQEGPIADVMNNIPKVVVSTTMKEATWQNSTLINSDVTAAITELKEKADHEIRVVGSLTLVRSLLQDNLLDELGLFIHPLFVGGGERLFIDGLTPAKLELVQSQTYSNGVIYTTYRPIDG